MLLTPSAPTALNMGSSRHSENRLLSFCPSGEDRNSAKWIFHDCLEKCFTWTGMCYDECGSWYWSNHTSIRSLSCLPLSGYLQVRVFQQLQPVEVFLGPRTLRQ